MGSTCTSSALIVGDSSRHGLWWNLEGKLVSSFSRVWEFGSVECGDGKRSIEIIAPVVGDQDTMGGVCVPAPDAALGRAVDHPGCIRHPRRPQHGQSKRRRHHRHPFCRPHPKLGPRRRLQTQRSSWADHSHPCIRLLTPIHPSYTPHTSPIHPPTHKTYTITNHNHTHAEQK